MSVTRSIAAVLKEPPGVSLADQTHPLAAVFTGAEALSAAIESDADWLWLLERGVDPDEDALQRLVQSIEPSGEEVASVVAGTVLDRAGRPVEDHLPAVSYADNALVVRLVNQRLLPIRRAPFANCLIRRSCFDRYGLPDVGGFGPFAVSAWTATVFGAETGYFAPLSVVRLRDDVSRAARPGVLTTARYAVRMRRSGAWTRGDLVRTIVREFGLSAGG